MRAHNTSGTHSARTECGFVSQQEAAQRMASFAAMCTTLESSIPREVFAEFNRRALDINTAALHATDRAEMSGMTRTRVEISLEEEDVEKHGSPTSLDDAIVQCVVNDRVKQMLPATLRKQVRADAQMIGCAPTHELLMQVSQFAAKRVRIAHMFFTDHMMSNGAVMADADLTALLRTWDNFQAQNLAPDQAMLLFQPLTTAQNEIAFVTGALVSKTLAALLEHYGRLDVWWNTYASTGGVLAVVMNTPTLARRFLELCWQALIGTCSTCNCRVARRLCSRCKRMRYCDVECQRRDWPRHRGYCQRHVATAATPAAAIAHVSSEQ